MPLGLGYGGMAHAARRRHRGSHVEGRVMLTPKVRETVRLSAHRRQVRLVRQSLITRPEPRDGWIGRNGQR